MGQEKHKDLSEAGPSLKKKNFSACKDRCVFVLELVFPCRGVCKYVFLISFVSFVFNSLLSWT